MLLLLPEVGERLEWPGVQADSGSLVLARLQPPASPGTLPSVALTAKVRAAAAADRKLGQSSPPHAFYFRQASLLRNASSFQTPFSSACA